MRAPNRRAILLAVLLFPLMLIFVTSRSADPKLWPPKAHPFTEIYVVSHGYHSGIVIERAQAAEIARQSNWTALLGVTQRFPQYRWLEIGWGDEGFYRAVPDAASVTAGLAVRALFMPRNPSVLHVVGLANDPRVTFPGADIVRIELSSAGFHDLLGRLEGSFTRGRDGGPEDLGSGLYGPSRFFRGAEYFYIFNLCNHWVARLLSAAGLPTSPVLATLPQGLLLDLRARAGLEPLPKPSG